MSDEVMRILTNAVVRYRYTSPSEPGVERLDAYENRPDAKVIAELIISELRNAGYAISKTK